MKRVQHGTSAGADAVSCRPADRVIPWGRSSVPIIKLVLELGLLFVCLQIGFSFASSTPPTYSLGIFADGAYEADTAQDHYYYVGTDHYYYVGIDTTSYWTGRSP